MNTAPNEREANRQRWARDPVVAALVNELLHSAAHQVVAIQSQKPPVGNWHKSLLTACRDAFYWAIGAGINVARTQGATVAFRVAALMLELNRRHGVYGVHFDKSLHAAAYREEVRLYRELLPPESQEELQLFEAVLEGKATVLSPTFAWEEVRPPAGLEDAKPDPQFALGELEVSMTREQAEALMARIDPQPDHVALEKPCP